MKQSYFHYVATAVQGLLRVWGGVACWHEGVRMIEWVSVNPPWAGRAWVLSRCVWWAGLFSGLSSPIPLESMYLYASHSYLQVYLQFTYSVLWMLYCTTVGVVRGAFKWESWYMTINFLLIWFLGISPTSRHILTGAHGHANYIYICTRCVHIHSQRTVS